MVSRKMAHPGCLQAPIVLLFDGNSKIEILSGPSYKIREWLGPGVMVQITGDWEYFTSHTYAVLVYEIDGHISLVLPIQLAPSFSNDEVTFNIWVIVYGQGTIEISIEEDGSAVHSRTGTVHWFLVDLN